MRTARFALLAMICTMFFACSKSKSGSSLEDSGTEEEGNIPVATEGYVLKDVNFAFDSSELSPASTAVLREHARWMSDNEQSSVTLEGHCDERGTAEYNLALGERRARSVFDFLRSAGVGSEQMRTVSYGEELPLDPRSTEEAWARNRRVHFAVGQ